MVRVRFSLVLPILLVLLNSPYANALYGDQFQVSGEEVGVNSYPTKPVPSLTQGELCKHPSTYRYPERIPYCERNVETETKREIIQTYEKLGYRIASRRAEFKIDHYYPLCAGGSNGPANLWPQYKEVYNVTDPLEQETCMKMAEGKLSQKEAIALIIQGKSDLSKVPAIRAHLRTL